MTIEIRDASLEARIQKQLQATGSSSVEEVLLRLLDTQEEQDRWFPGSTAVFSNRRMSLKGSLDGGGGKLLSGLDSEKV
jgi:hypothetical protein